MSARPKSVRAVFLLTMFKLLLSWGFFAVFSFRGGGPVDTSTLGYTAVAYVALAIPTFVFIHRRNAVGVRVCIALAIVASIPARAVIAIFVDVVAMALTFRGSAKRFFAQEA